MTELAIKMSNGRDVAPAQRDACNPELIGMPEESVADY